MQATTLPPPLSLHLLRLRQSWAAIDTAGARLPSSRAAPRHMAATGRVDACLPLSRESPNGTATCGGDLQRRCAPPVVAGESPRHVAATGTAGARLPSSRASPNGSAACGGDRQRRCAPPVVAGESERLRGMWRRPSAPLCASRCRGRVRMAPRHVAATDAACARFRHLERVRRAPCTWQRLALPVRASLRRGW